RAQEISQRLAAAREAYGETRGKVVNSQKLMSELQAKLGESAQLPTTDLRGNHDRLKREVEMLLARRKELAALTDTLLQLKQAEAGARQILDQAGNQTADSASALATTKAQVQSAEKELPEAYRAAGSLDKAIVLARKEAGALEQQITAARENHKHAHGLVEASSATLVAAEKTRHSAQTALAEALANQKAALAASPLADEPAYRNALLEESQATALRQAISDYDQQCLRISGALEQQRTAVQDQSRPDLERVATELHQAEAAKIEADSRWQQLDGRRQNLEATRKKLQKAAAQQAELDRRYAIIGTLSDVANGQTGNKISLQRFVLSVLLDDVLIEASHRLSLMSKGRYQLLRKEDRAKGNKASGLELEVEDAYTGKVRPVATLSGGESFMAALAMALGLSDVVQAYAGGIRLDTLFIDEGFGSLDAESLDLAIRTLIDLQASGRMIGIISHVAELKEQMPLRLDVIAGRDGSRVRLVRP
uniref:SbcC/MukB-like Walker B domain-containing protein n=1 Tax=Trichloromonas sp. TaxID=3069249 RepID=UPI003D818384